jgi:hypothetical protein
MPALIMCTIVLSYIYFPPSCNLQGYHFKPTLSQLKRLWAQDACSRHIAIMYHLRDIFTCQVHLQWLLKKDIDALVYEGSPDEEPLTKIDPAMIHDPSVSQEQQPIIIPMLAAIQCGRVMSPTCQPHQFQSFSWSLLSCNDNLTLSYILDMHLLSSLICHTNFLFDIFTFQITQFFSMMTHYPCDMSVTHLITFS